jgi:AcrR family transcriptional regulator
MSAQKMNTEARREQIARAALELFAHEGVEGFSIAKLAQAVGLVPSAIYRHFSSKEEVLEASLDVFRDKLYGLVEAARDESDNPLETLESLLNKHAKLVSSGKGAPHLLLSSDVSSGHAERRAKLHGIFNGYIKRIEGITREGQAQGSIRKDIESETIALLFAGLIQPAALLMITKGKSFDLPKHVSKAWLLFSQAIRPE